MSDFKGILRLALQALIRNKVAFDAHDARHRDRCRCGHCDRRDRQRCARRRCSNRSTRSARISSSCNRAALRARRAHAAGSAPRPTLTPADGMAIAQLPSVSAVSPAVTVRAQVVASGNNWQTTVTGVAPTYSFIRSWPMASGTFFTENDVNDAAKVAVLGQTDVSATLPERRESDRANGSDQGRPVHRRRHALGAGPEQPRHRSRRHRADSLYLGDATPHRPNDGQSADGLGHDIRRHRRRANRNDDAARTTSPHRNRSSPTTSKCAICSRSQRRHRRPAR